MPNIDPKDYEKKKVPERMLHAIKVLNDALAIDARMTKAILDSEYLLKEVPLAAFLAHNSIVVRGEGERSFLTGLGLLGGCVNDGPFRIMVTEEDDGTWSSFGIYEEIA